MFRFVVTAKVWVEKTYTVKASSKTHARAIFRKTYHRRNKSILYIAGPSVCDTQEWRDRISQTMKARWANERERMLGMAEGRRLT